MIVYNYDEISKVYDDVRDGDYEIIKEMLRCSDLQVGDNILEIGCGTGNYIKMMPECFNLYGIDQSTGMLLKAKEKCNNVAFTAGDAIRLEDYKDNQFDLIYMVDVIHHIKEEEIFFNNIYRILKDNGRLYIFTDSHEHIKNRLTTKYFPKTLKYELNRYQSFDELAGLLTCNNYKNIKSGIVNMPPVKNYGKLLINIAKKRAYSMFTALSDEEINEGIKNIQLEIDKGINIEYHTGATYIKAQK
ncbi:methyltransferase domain-containing protein [Clostridiaceae bacterium M8S5]|nr:methyltransferase domain-containing protein [Clostridiaceae bacterium M8S5]